MPATTPGSTRAVSGASMRPEAQRVHDRDRPGAHRQDVADDAADAGGRALVRLDVGRVVVRLDLEGDGPAVADVDHAGVLAHADQQRVRLRRRLVAELPQVHLGRLVGAVLAPHHRVDGQLGAGRAAAEDLADPGVLVLLHAQLGEGLRLVRRVGRVLDGVDTHAGTPAREREEAEAVGARPGQRLDGVLGVRHQPDDVAGRVGDAGDVAVGAVGVAAEVAHDDPALGLELVEGALVGDVAALAVLQRDDDLLALAVLARPGRGRVLDAQPLVAADELAVVVADQRAGQQVRLAEHLEAVADAEHRQAVVGRRR